MGVAVEEEGWLEALEKGEEGGEALVCDVIVVVYAPGWGVGDEDIEVATVAGFVSKEARDHAEEVDGDLLLGVLVGSFVVEGTTFETGYEEGGNTVSCADFAEAGVEVEEAGIGGGKAMVLEVVGCGAMVTDDVEHGGIEGGDEEVEVVGW